MILFGLSGLVSWRRQILGIDNIYQLIECCVCLSDHLNILSVSFVQFQLESGWREYVSGLDPVWRNCAFLLKRIHLTGNIVFSVFYIVMHACIPYSKPLYKYWIECKLSVNICLASWCLFVFEVSSNNMLITPDYIYWSDVIYVRCEFTRRLSLSVLNFTSCFARMTRISDSSLGSVSVTSQASVIHSES